MSNLSAQRLTQQEVRDMLAENHGVLLGDDDPILLYVTMHNAFLDQYDEVLNRHGKAVTAFLKKLSAQYAGEINAHKKAILSKAVRSSVENTVQEIVLHKSSMNEFLAELKRHRSYVTLCTAIMALLTFIVALLTAGSFLGGPQ